ncbi:glycoside hydrolase family 32 protein [Paenibacillus wenxiniae]|uniref:Glycoside hydrolase family 32 protein n=1 Tax=Paenibacillus wenxiniae TaxID=1636843 RepID=A0ABW4RIW3_9BACL
MNNRNDRNTSRTTGWRRWVWPLGLTGVIAVGTTACYELQSDTMSESSTTQAEASGQSSLTHLSNGNNGNSLSNPSNGLNGQSQQDTSALHNELFSTGQQANGYRSNYHFTVPDKWKNDPQRPVYANGKYHYYYLYNKDYPKGNGTEWRHATSTDLVHWQDQGVAIPKYTSANGDPWSGSVVVDTNNTAGLGKNAMIAIVTQPSANGGAQEQYLWFSTDGGHTFKAFGKKPILSNPGNADFRDPKLVWDQQSRRWIMLMAEGNRIGFYTSSNLKSWRYVSDFVADDIGTLECPDLYRMRASNGTYKWVLGVSANGRASGQPNTYAYWIGTFNGLGFKADDEKPQWLDYGFDWYAAVTFEDGTTKQPYDHRYALAWMNNWDYANNTPTLQDGYNGTDSMVRQIQLKKLSGSTGYTLLSQPIRGLSTFVTATRHIPRVEVDGRYNLDVKASSYQVDADITWSDLKNAGFQLRRSPDGSRHVDAGVFVEGGYTYVNRAYTGHPDTSNNLLESRAPFNPANKKVHLKILVDKTSVEMFVDGGQVTLSNLVFPKPGDQGIALYSEGGKAVFDNVTIKYLGK